MYTLAKVRELEFSLNTDQNVLGLYIAVYNVLAIHMLKSARYLCSILGGFPFGQTMLSTQLLVKLSLCSEFEREKYPLVVVEVAVKFEDIGMTQVGLNFNVVADLLLHLVFFKFGLVQGLQLADIAATAFRYEIKPPEFTFA